MSDETEGPPEAASAVVNKPIYITKIYGCNADSTIERVMENVYYRIDSGAMDREIFAIYANFSRHKRKL
jgi:hypothetical protein